jgi:hypothetical protein
VVDHVVALKRGGEDAPANMQWQTIADAKAKDWGRVDVRRLKAACLVLRPRRKAGRRPRQPKCRLLFAFIARLELQKAEPPIVQAPPVFSKPR